MTRTPSKPEPGGKTLCLVVCDHESNRFPEALGGLGLAEPHRREHIAWDIGAAENTGL